MRIRWLLISGASTPSITTWESGVTANVVRFKGQTKGGGYAELSVMLDRCEFYGDPQELQMILDGNCPDRRCGHG